MGQIPSITSYWRTESQAGNESTDDMPLSSMNQNLEKTTQRDTDEESPSNTCTTFTECPLWPPQIGLTDTTQSSGVLAFPLAASPEEFKCTIRAASSSASSSTSPLTLPQGFLSLPPIMQHYTGEYRQLCYYPCQDNIPHQCYYSILPAAEPTARPMSYSVTCTNRLQERTSPANSMSHGVPGNAARVPLSPKLTGTEIPRSVNKQAKSTSEASAVHSTSVIATKVACVAKAEKHLPPAIPPIAVQPQFELGPFKHNTLGDVKSSALAIDTLEQRVQAFSCSFQNVEAKCAESQGAQISQVDLIKHLDELGQVCGGMLEMAVSFNRNWPPSVLIEDNELAERRKRLGLAMLESRRKYQELRNRIFKKLEVKVNGEEIGSLPTTSTPKSRDTIAQAIVGASATTSQRTPAPVRNLSCDNQKPYSPNFVKPVRLPGQWSPRPNKNSSAPSLSGEVPTFSLNLTHIKARYQQPQEQSIRPHPFYSLSPNKPNASEMYPFPLLTTQIQEQTPAVSCLADQQGVEKPTQPLSQVQLPALPQYIESNHQTMAGGVAAYYMPDSYIFATATGRPPQSSPGAVPGNGLGPSKPQTQQIMEQASLKVETSRQDMDRMQSDLAIILKAANLREVLVQAGDKLGPQDKFWLKVAEKSAKSEVSPSTTSKSKRNDNTATAASMPQVMHILTSNSNANASSAVEFSKTKKNKKKKKRRAKNACATTSLKEGTSMNANVPKTESFGPKPKSTEPLVAAAEGRKAVAESTGGPSKSTSDHRELTQTTFRIRPKTIRTASSNALLNANVISDILSTNPATAASSNSLRKHAKAKPENPSRSSFSQLSVTDQPARAQPQLERTNYTTFDPVQEQPAKAAFQIANNCGISYAVTKTQPVSATPNASCDGDSSSFHHSNNFVDKTTAKETTGNNKAHDQTVSSSAQVGSEMKPAINSTAGRPSIAARFQEKGQIFPELVALPKSAAEPLVTKNQQNKPPSKAQSILPRTPLPTKPVLQSTPHSVSTNVGPGSRVAEQPPMDTITRSPITANLGSTDKLSGPTKANPSTPTTTASSSSNICHDIHFVNGSKKDAAKISNQRQVVEDQQMELIWKEVWKAWVEFYGASDFGALLNSQDSMKYMARAIEGAAKKLALDPSHVVQSISLWRQRHGELMRVIQSDAKLWVEVLQNWLYNESRYRTSQGYLTVVNNRMREYKTKGGKFVECKGLVREMISWEMVKHASKELGLLWEIKRVGFSEIELLFRRQVEKQVKRILEQRIDEVFIDVAKRYWNVQERLPVKKNFKDLLQPSEGFGKGKVLLVSNTNCESLLHDEEYDYIEDDEHSLHKPLGYYWAPKFKNGYFWDMEAIMSKRDPFGLTPINPYTEPAFLQAMKSARWEYMKEARKEVFMGQILTMGEIIRLEDSRIKPPFFEGSTNSTAGSKCDFARSFTNESIQLYIPATWYMPTKSWLRAKFPYGNEREKRISKDVRESQD